MNTSKLVELIKENPGLLNEVEKFIEVANTPNILHKYTTREIVTENEEFISFAEQNGGLCTRADIEAAQKLIEQEPFHKEAEARIENLKAAIESGDVKSIDDMKAKFAETPPVKENPKDIEEVAEEASEAVIP
jgi:anti-sigma28 factor (negative regulator of flagellin synthesis)